MLGDDLFARIKFLSATLREIRDPRARLLEDAWALYEILAVKGNVDRTIIDKAIAQNMLDWIVRSGNYDLISIMYPLAGQTYLNPDWVMRNVKVVYSPHGGNIFINRPTLIFDFPRYVADAISSSEYFATDDGRSFSKEAFLDELKKRQLPKFLEERVVAHLGQENIDIDFVGNDRGDSVPDYVMYYSDDGRKFPIEVKLAPDRIELSVARYWLSGKTNSYVDAIFREFERNPVRTRNAPAPGS